MIVRKMEEKDLEASSKLAGQLVRQHHGFDPKRFFLTDDVEDGYRWYFGTQLAEPKSVLLVAEFEGEVAGYLYGSVEPRDWAKLLDRHGAIHDVFVDARFRRRGVARALMEAGVRELEKRGAPRVVLYSAQDNADAQTLFSQLGFRRTMVEMTREKE